MPSRIEDYALVGDCETAALVGRDGSIDWLCWPRFDSSACFAALLGGSEHGRWLVAPEDPAPRVTRRYREGTLILETDFETGDGAVTLIDFMPCVVRHQTWCASLSESAVRSRCGPSWSSVSAMALRFRGSLACRMDLAFAPLQAQTWPFFGRGCRSAARISPLLGNSRSVRESVPRSSSPTAPRTCRCQSRSTL